MAQQRLPTVSGDDGQWGDILNLFLAKEHYNTGLDNVLNGGHKKITILPGTPAALTAPLKFTSGSLMTAPEAGAVEFLTDRFYVTQTSGVAPRKAVATYYDDGNGATGDVYYRDASGNFIRLAAGTNTHVLTLAGGVPTWAAAPGGGGGLSQQQVMAISSMRI